MGGRGHCGRIQAQGRLEHFDYERWKFYEGQSDECDQAVGSAVVDPGEETAPSI